MTETIDYYKIALGMAIFDSFVFSIVVFFTEPAADIIAKELLIIEGIIIGVITGFIQAFAVWLYVRISNFTIGLLKPLAALIPEDKTEIE